MKSSNRIVSLTRTLASNIIRSGKLAFSLWRRWEVGHEDLNTDHPWLAVPLAGSIELNDTAPRSGEVLNVYNSGVRVTDVNSDGSKYYIRGAGLGPAEIRFSRRSSNELAGPVWSPRGIRIRCYVFRPRTIKVHFLYSNSGSTATSRDLNDESIMIDRTNSILKQAIAEVRSVGSLTIDLSQQRGEVAYDSPDNPSRSQRLLRGDIRRERQRDELLREADVVVLFVKNIARRSDAWAFTEVVNNIIVIQDDQPDHLTLAHELIHWCGYVAPEAIRHPENASHNTLRGNIMAEGTYTDADGEEHNLMGRRLTRRQIFLMHGVVGV